MMNVKVKSERGGEGDCMNGTFQKAEILEYGTRMSELESWQIESINLENFISKIGSRYADYI